MSTGGPHYDKFVVLPTKWWESRWIESNDAEVGFVTGRETPQGAPGGSLCYELLFSPLFLNSRKRSSVTVTP